MEPQGLTGGGKAGRFFLGFFLSMLGILIIWLMDKDDGLKLKDGVLFGIIGNFSAAIVGIILGVVFWVVIVAVVASDPSLYSGTYY